MRIDNESSSNLEKRLKCTALSFNDVHYQFHIRIFTSYPQNKMFSDIVKYMCMHIRKKKILQKSGIHFLHSFIKNNFVRKKISNNNLFKIWSFYVCMIIFAIVEFNCTCTCMFNYMYNENVCIPKWVHFNSLSRLTYSWHQDNSICSLHSNNLK